MATPATAAGELCNLHPSIKTHDRAWRCFDCVVDQLSQRPWTMVVHVAGGGLAAVGGHTKGVLLGVGKVVKVQ